MSWRDYERLIKNCVTDPERWIAARDANPNDPLSAIMVALEHVGHDDVAHMLLALAGRVIVNEGHYKDWRKDNPWHDPEPDYDDSLPDWADFYPTWQDYMIHEYPEVFGGDNP